MYKYILAAIAIFGIAFAITASATVTVANQPEAMFEDPIVARASSGPVALFKFALTANEGETLASVSITINNTNSSNVSADDIAAVSVYKDSGDEVFNPSGDLLSGTNATVNIDTPTTVVTSDHNTLDGAWFYVTLTTSASWSDLPSHSITVTLSENSIATSEGIVATTAQTTPTITADTTSPLLTGAVAKNTSGTNTKGAGDTVELAFSEPTNKPEINAGNINTYFVLSNSKTFLDGAGELGGALWNQDGTTLTVTLSASSTLPTVEVGNTITVTALVLDLAGNPAQGSQTITGSFTETTEILDPIDMLPTDTKCQNGLINGRLYKTDDDDPTVYLAAACRLKPFRGAAVFHARGLKFQNILTLDSLDNYTVSQKPVLPAAGTLAKGSDPTVWFITSKQERRAFRTAEKFFALGFGFDQVEMISDEDLSLIPASNPIEQNEPHPDGALMKCVGSAEVFQIINNRKFSFANPNAFLNKGHSWRHIGEINCEQFSYQKGSPITK